VLLKPYEKEVSMIVDNNGWGLALIEPVPFDSLFKPLGLLGQTGSVYSGVPL
jgi:hypothetical protein